MTNSQIKAYHDSEDTRLGIRKYIVAFFEDNRKEYTIRELSKELGLTYKQLQPRVSELSTDRILIESRSKEESGVYNSVYTLNKDSNAVKKLTRLQTLESCIKKSVDEKTYNAIMDEFKRLVLYSK